MKKLKLFIGLLFVVALIGCNNSGGKEQSQKGVVTKKIDSLDSTKTNTIFDTIGLFFELDYIGNSSYRACWGNSSRDESIDTITILESSSLSLQAMKGSCIFLRQGCGTSCSFGYVLPITKNSKAKYYMYPLAIDVQNNLIAYNGENLNYLVTIENYQTGEKKYFETNFLPGPYPGHSIDSISFLENELYVEWKSFRGEHKKDHFKINR